MSEKNKAPRERAEVFADLKAVMLHDDEAMKRFPFLTDVLKPKYKDGVMTRVAGVMTLTVEGAAWRVSIRCEEEGLQTVAVVSSLVDLFSCLETFLSSEKAVWTMTYNAKKRLDSLGR